MKTARSLVALGAIVLLATAIIHATGYRELAKAIQASGVAPVLVSALKGLWLMLSIHLVVLGALLIVATTVAGGRRIIFMAGLIPLADTVLLFHFAGIFVGTIALGLATIFIFSGGLLWPESAPRLGAAMVQKTRKP